MNLILTVLPLSLSLFLFVSISPAHSTKATVFQLKPKPFTPKVLTQPKLAATAEKYKPKPNNRAAAAAKASSSGSELCGGAFAKLKDGDHGYIQSPNYPNAYPAGTECLWKLQAASSDTRIYLTVFDLRTFSDPFSDASDSIFISLLGEWNETQRFSGDLNALTPMNLVTQDTNLLVRFKSSLLGGNRRGFRMGYQVRKKPALLQPSDDVLAATCTYIPVDTPAVHPDYGQGKKKVNTPCPGEPQELNTLSRQPGTPYLVALVLDDGQFCSGALISPQYVLTSAHCTSGVSKLELIFGTEDLTLTDLGVQRRTENSSALIQHTGFSPNAGLNDISIIKLTEPVQITRFVKPVRLPTWNVLQDTLVGVESQVSGWGEQGGLIESKTTISPVEISPNKVCRTSLHKALSGMMLCLVPPNPNVCKADSGSPVATRCGGQQQNAQPVGEGEEQVQVEDEHCRLTENILLGVMSFGNCEHGFAFTRLMAQLDFITLTTGIQLG